jgi:prevent-host-death family protein
LTFLYGAVQLTKENAMENRVGAEEARNNLPELLASAENGVTTVITKRGRPVAVLAPFKAYESIARQPSFLDLEGSGRGLWGKDSTETLKKLRKEWER